MLKNTAIKLKWNNMDGKNKTDLELIASFLGEDPEQSRIAFGILYMKYQHTLLDRLYRKIGDEEEIKDCLQKIWLKLVEKLKSYRVTADGNGNIGGLLIKMADDETADYFRRVSRTRHESLVVVSSDGELVEREPEDRHNRVRTRVLRREIVDIINKALEYFVKKDRRIFWGIIKGETAEEISHRTGYTEATVKKKFSLQKVRVRFFLSFYGYTPDSLPDVC